jgi:tetratricopeptide (TPR) repeat protein
MQKGLKKLLPVALLFFCLLVRAQSLAPISEPPGSASVNSAREASRRGEELRRRWELDGAEAAFREASALDPTNLEAALGLARIFQSRLDYAGAKRLIDQAREFHPQSSEVAACYGWLYLAAEDAARAKEYFEAAARLNPSLPELELGRAGVDLLGRDFKSAQSRLQQIIKRNPDAARARSMLARALLEENKTQEAALESERALTIDPFDIDAMSVLAFVRATERKAHEVRLLARRALALDPSSPGIRRLLAQYLNGQAGYDQKISDEARRRFATAAALKKTGRLKEAAVELEAIVKLEPRYYSALIALGDLRLRERDYERAAEAARLAIEADEEGALAHLELSYALWGMQERARKEIGAIDFETLFYSRPDPPAFSLTKEIFPDYSSLTRRQQIVIDTAVAPMAVYLTRLARSGARHHLLGFDQRVSDLGGFDNLVNERTFDGRYYASLRGVGGRATVSGIEHIDVAARGGFHAIAHEFAHQVHLTAMDKEEVAAIRRLYEMARREGRLLDYYAASNEYEYFAQGYEAFVSERKRPSAGVTARHTRAELAARDPQLYRFLTRIAARFVRRA